MLTQKQQIEHAVVAEVFDDDHTTPEHENFDPEAALDWFDEIDETGPVSRLVAERLIQAAYTLGRNDEAAGRPYPYGHRPLSVDGAKRLLSGRFPFGGTIYGEAKVDEDPVRIESVEQLLAQPWANLWIVERAGMGVR